MTDQTPLLLNELYAARLAGDLERLCRVFADDVRFRITGASDGKPIAITACGIAETRTWLAMLLKTFRMSDARRLALLVDGERAAVHWQVDIHSKITGSRSTTELMDLLELRSGRIAAYTEFFVPR